MLGLLLIFFIGKYFYDLAGLNGKSTWGYAILGVISYYAGTFLGGILIGMGYEIWGSPGALDRVDELLFSFMALPFGVLACIGVYNLLKNTWKKGHKGAEDLIDEIGDGQP